MDRDGRRDEADNCSSRPNGPLVGSSDQTDSDTDGYGNACDCDFDNDGECSLADFSGGFLPDFIAGQDSGVGTDMNGEGTVNLGDFGPFVSGLENVEPGPSGFVP